MSKSFTYTLLEQGNSTNSPTNKYYIESPEALDLIEGAPVGSKAILVKEDGELLIYYLRSTGWVEIK